MQGWFCGPRSNQSGRSRRSCAISSVPNSARSTPADPWWTRWPQIQRRRLPGVVADDPTTVCPWSVSHRLASTDTCLSARARRVSERRSARSQYLRWRAAAATTRNLRPRRHGDHGPRPADRPRRPSATTTPRRPRGPVRDRHRRPEDKPGGAGDEVPAQSQALITGKGGKLSPLRVRVPPFIAIKRRAAIGRRRRLPARRTRRRGSQSGRRSQVGHRPLSTG